MRLNRESGRVVSVAARRRFVLSIAGSVALLASACSTPGTAPGAGPYPRFSPRQLIKSDTDHLVEANQRRIFGSLRRLAVKLYLRNPNEWRKGSADVGTAIGSIFDVNHSWRFEDLGYRRDIEALQIAFHPQFRGDRVRAFTVGLGSMVQTAFGNSVDFYLLNDLSAQRFYNAARNVEIAAWKLGTTRDAAGSLMLLSNEMGEVNNLSFEREIGRIIGLLEVLADVIEVKTERTVVRVVQNMATAVFLPLH